MDDEGKFVGIVGISEALRLAGEAGIDLIEVSPKAVPPVCKMGDAARLRYEQKKRLQAGKKKQTKIQLKEVRLRPAIEQHDFDVKLKGILRFLADGCHVKILVRFRGREVLHNQDGRDLLAKILEQVGALAVAEAPVKLDGKQMILKIIPRKTPA